MEGIELDRFLEEIDFPSLTPSPEPRPSIPKQETHSQPASSTAPPQPTPAPIHLHDPAPQYEEVHMIGAGLTNFGSCNLSGRISVLQLHGNRISSMRGLESCPNITELILSSNNISRIEGLGPSHRKLQFLDLSCNKLFNLKGVAGLTALQKLLVPFNRVESLEALEVLWGQNSNLQILDVRDNNINNLHEFASLRGLSKLKTLKLAVGKNRNPITSHPHYRAAILQAAPLTVSNLDEQEVSIGERDQARHAALLAFAGTSTSSHQPARSQTEPVHHSPAKTIIQENSAPQPTTQTPSNDAYLSNLGFLPHPTPPPKKKNLQSTLNSLSKGCSELESELHEASETIHISDEEDISLQQDMKHIHKAMAKLDKEIRVLSKAHAASHARAENAAIRLTNAHAAKVETLNKLREWQGKESQAIAALPPSVDFQASPSASPSNKKKVTDSIVLEESPLSPRDHNNITNLKIEQLVVQIEDELHTARVQQAAASPSPATDNDMLDPEDIPLLARSHALRQAADSQYETNIALEEDLEVVRENVRKCEDELREKEKVLAGLAGRLLAETEAKQTSRILLEELQVRHEQQQIRRQERLQLAEQAKLSIARDVQTLRVDAESATTDAQLALQEAERLTHDMHTTRAKAFDEEARAREQEEARAEERATLEKEIALQTTNLENELKDLLTAAHERVVLLESELASAEDLKTSQENQNAALESEHNQTNHILQTGQDQLDILTKESNQLDSKLKSLHSDISSAQSLLLQHAKDIQNLQVQYDLAESRSEGLVPLTQLEEIQSQCTILETNLDELTCKINEAKETTNLKTVQADEQRRLVSDLNEKLATAKYLATNTDTDLQSALDKVKELKDRLESKDTNLREVESERSKRDNDWQDVLEKEINITNEHQKKFESEQKLLQKLEEHCGELRDVLRAREEELESVKKEVLTMTDHYKSRETEAQALQEHLREEIKQKMDISNQQLEVIELQLEGVMREKLQQEHVLKNQLEQTNQKVKTTENEITVVESQMRKKAVQLAERMRGVHAHLAGLRDSTQRL